MQVRGSRVPQCVIDGQHAHHLDQLLDPFVEADLGLEAQSAEPAVVDLVVALVRVRPYLRLVKVEVDVFMDLLGDLPFRVVHGGITDIEDPAVHPLEVRHRKRVDRGRVGAVLAIVVPLVRVMPKFLKNRAAKVREDIDSAKKVTDDANARLSAVEAKLASIGDEIAKFRAEVERESSQDEARIKATIEEESTRIVAAAEQEIGVAAAQAKRALRHFAADLAIEQAAKQLVLTAETDRALIAEFVGDVAKGGLN